MKERLKLYGFSPACESVHTEMFCNVLQDSLSQKKTCRSAHICMVSRPYESVHVLQDCCYEKMICRTAHICMVSRCESVYDFEDSRFEKITCNTYHICMVSRPCEWCPRRLSRMLSICTAVSHQCALIVCDF